MSQNIEPLGQVVNISLPILFLIIAISSFIWFGIEVKKKRIEFKSMVSWLTLNILFTIVITYILIISILHFYYIDNISNVFNLIAHYAFNIDLQNGKEWVIILILAFISYILIKSLRNTIKISRLNKRIDILGKEVAILSGKVNKSARFAKEVAMPKATHKDVKSELREKVKIARAKKKAKMKLEAINSPKEKIKD